MAAQAHKLTYRVIIVVAVMLYAAALVAWVLPVHYSSFETQMMGRTLSVALIGVFAAFMNTAPAAVLLLTLHGLFVLGIIIWWSRLPYLLRLMSVSLLVMNSAPGVCTGIFSHIGATNVIFECSPRDHSRFRIDTFIFGLDGFIYFVSHSRDEGANWTTVFVRGYENPRMLDCSRMGSSPNDSATQWVWIDTDVAITHDDGQTWHVNERNQVWLGRVWEDWVYIETVRFESRLNGQIVVVSDDTTRYTFSTHDGGITWGEDARGDE